MVSRLTREDGSALILIIGVIATLAVLTTALVIMTGNLQSNTAGERQRNKAFNVAEAGLDAIQYTLGSSWPSQADMTPTIDTNDFRAQFVTSEFPDPQTGEFISVDYYDNLDPVDPNVHWDSNDDGIMWIESQANVGKKKARIRTEIERQVVGVQTIMPGVAVYSGGDITLTGSSKVLSPSQGGQPTSGLYTANDLSLSNDSCIVQAAKVIGGWERKPAYMGGNVYYGSTVPPLSQFMPPDVVQSLTESSQISPNSGTQVSNSTPGMTSWPYGVSFSTPCYCTGNLNIGAEGTYNFTSLYVAGNFTIGGNTTVNCTSLYVGGYLSVGGGANTQSFGPTFVNGNVTFGGYQHFNIPLLVTNGAVDVGGSQFVGGDGVGTNPPPCLLLMTGSNKNFNYSGNCRFYGLVCNMGGTVTISGSNALTGGVLASGDVELSGVGNITYNPDVMNSFSGSVASTARAVPDTWQEIQPL